MKKKQLNDETRQMIIESFEEWINSLEASDEYTMNGFTEKEILEKMKNPKDKFGNSFIRTIYNSAINLAKYASFESKTKKLPDGVRSLEVHVIHNSRLKKLTKTQIQTALNLLFFGPKR